MKILVLGAGPAGLTVANRLSEMGKDVLVLEKNSEAGGLCRSRQVDGAPFDIGGGHFLDTKRERVNQFLFQFMPESEWNRYERNSQIFIHNSYINSPIEANIWQLEIEEQVEYLKEIAKAGCNTGEKIPDKFVDWIYWKLGKKIAEDYMIPYNQKMFAEELNYLGTYWLDKLPDVSFEETLRSCLLHKPYGKQPAHAKFYYPRKYGYGEVWKRMADKLNGRILYNVKVKSIDFRQKHIRTAEGEYFAADIIISTIPWSEFNELIGMPEKFILSIKQLKNSAIETRYFQDKLDTKAHWIYYPDNNLPYHRILVRANFCSKSRGYWTETRKERIGMFSNDENKNFRFINDYAYPLNTIGKQEIMTELLDWCKNNQVFGLGRWGEHQHYNSDVVVELGLKMAEMLGR